VLFDSGLEGGVQIIIGSITDLLSTFRYVIADGIMVCLNSVIQLKSHSDVRYGAAGLFAIVNGRLLYCLCFSTSRLSVRTLSMVSPSVNC
jgi:hypothetical protein